MVPNEPPAKRDGMTAGLDEASRQAGLSHPVNQILAATPYVDAMVTLSRHGWNAYERGKLLNDVVAVHIDVSLNCIRHGHHR
jgi:hypothetical protein